MTDARPTADLLIASAAELLTCAGPPPDGIGLIPNGSVAIAGGRILAAGPAHEVSATIDTTNATILDASGKVVIPGLVDCHTHVVFGGSRVEEYVARLTGGDLDALKARGAPVGIVGTVQATNALSVDGLVEQTLPRLRAMLEHGTTTVESKSGYALTTSGELRMLEANRRLAALQPVEIVSTFLGAHALPPDRPRDRYVDEVIQEMIPRVAEENLAEFCDVFCEEGYFTLSETERILRAGLDHGLAPKLHLDQYSHSGAAALAAALGCASVDHLNFTNPDELRLLADAGVVGVPLPALDFAVAHPRPVDSAPLLAAGLELGLATDICPGCWCPSMPLVIALAGRLAHLSPAAAIRAATIGAARAVGRADLIGSLEPGKQADLLILDLPRHEDLTYRLGHNPVETVIKCGAIARNR